MAMGDVCLCAFCKNERRVYRKKHISALTIVSVVFLSSLFSFVFYQAVHPLMFVVALAGLSLAEVSIQLRWRMHVRCPHCGFDPVLYLRDPSRAAVKVKDFVAEKRKDPTSLLRPDPLRNLMPRSRDF